MPRKRKEYNEDGLKHCYKCGEWLRPLEDFNANSLRWDGRRNKCKLCDKVERKRYLADDPERGRASNISRYKISDGVNTRSMALEDKRRIYNKQDGRCAICKSALVFQDRNTHIDHNASTGLVRALLCHHCNTGIGSFKESTIILDAAIMYLIAHNEIGYGNVG